LIASSYLRTSILSVFYDPTSATIKVVLCEEMRGPISINFGRVPQFMSPFKKKISAGENSASQVSYFFTRGLDFQK